MGAKYPDDLLARGQAYVESLSIESLSASPASRIAKIFAEQNGLANTCIEGLGISSGVYHHSALKGFQAAKDAYAQRDVKAAGIALGVVDAFMTANQYPLAQCPEMAVSILGTTHEELVSLISFAHPDLKVA